MESIVSPKNNITQNDNNKNIDQSLMSLLEATTAKIGEDFFNVFVTNLAKAYGAKMAFVNELIENEPLKVRSLAFWLNGKLADNIEYTLATTPCESVYRNGESYFPSDLQTSFPDDQDLVDLDMHSYLGIVLNNKEGEPIGHICVLGKEPVGDSENASTFLKIFSARASAELERLKAEREIINQRTYLKEIFDEQTIDLRREKEVSEKANQTKSEFLARMSHELRTPMHSILGYADIIQNDEDNMLSDKNKVFLNNIVDSGNNLMKLLNRVLDFSLIESGELEVIPSVSKVKDIIDECIASEKMFAEKNNIHIHYADDITNIHRIEVDSTRLKQVITSLISNAIKFNKPNGEVIIDLKSTKDQKVQILVTDTGPGISETEQSIIFEKFERLGANKECIPGIGIGLAITKRLVKLMGGTINIVSSKNTGTTFLVEFNKF